MDRRRVLLLAALVLGTAALIASLSTPQGGGSDNDSPPGPSQTTTEAAEPTRELRLDVTRRSIITIARGSHVVLRVEVPEPGEVAIPELGLTGNAAPGTPARFDVLAERTGRYDLIFVPAGGESRRAGTLVVER
jgi:hypothetical protein